jgi:phage terminase small subunit
MPTQTLTPLQRRFAEEYIVDLNGSAAYLRAGYRAKSDNIAAVGASNLLRNTNVASYVQELRSQRSHSTGITAERVLQELGRLAFSDIRSVMEFDSSGFKLKTALDSEGEDLEEDLPVVRLKPSTVLSDDAAAAISAISESRTRFGTTTTVKLHNKVQALKLLAQHTGLLGDLNIARSILRTYGLEVDINEFGQPTKLIQIDAENDSTSEEVEQEDILSDVESYQETEET